MKPGFLHYKEGILFLLASEQVPQSSPLFAFFYYFPLIYDPESGGRLSNSETICCF